MRNKLICWLPIIVVAQVSMIESVQAQGWWAYHHAPYQDQHFNLDSTRRTDAGGYTNSSRSSYRDTAGPSVSSEYTPSGGSNCSANGSCATAKNALLRLWIPDGLSVEINGYQTSPQSLGGIHKNSRIFSLEELDRDRLSPCDIVVHAYDEVGQRTSYHYALAVQAGGHYQVRFPHGFQPVHASVEPEIPGIGFEVPSTLDDQSVSGMSQYEGIFGDKVEEQLSHGDDLKAPATPPNN